jgi:hypothetical protein
MNRITMFRQQFANNTAVKFIKNMQETKSVKFIKEFVSEENRKGVSKAIIGTTALLSIYNGLAVEYNISKNLPINQPAFAEDDEDKLYDRFLKNSFMSFVGSMYYIAPFVAIINLSSMTNIAGAGIGLIVMRNVNPLNFSNIKINYTSETKIVESKK